MTKCSICRSNYLPPNHAILKTGLAVLVAAVLAHTSILLLWFVHEAALEVLRGVSR